MPFCHHYFIDPRSYTPSKSIVSVGSPAEHAVCIQSASSFTLYNHSSLHHTHCCCRLPAVHAVLINQSSFNRSYQTHRQMLLSSIIYAFFNRLQSLVGLRLNTLYCLISSLIYALLNRLSFVVLLLLYLSSFTYPLVVGIIVCPL